MTCVLAPGWLQVRLLGLKRWKIWKMLVFSGISLISQRFFCSESAKKIRKHHPFDDYKGPQNAKVRCAATAATTTATTTTTTRRRRRTKTRTRTRADLSCLGTAKLHQSRIVVHLHVHMSFAIAEKPPLPLRTFPPTAMCHLQFSLHVTLSINIPADRKPCS